jgi:hypothetical protein
MRQREGVLPARAARLLLGEAVAAVDRSVLAGLKGHTRCAAATGADRLKHLAGAAVATASSVATTPVTAAAAVSALGLPTGRATLGFLVFALRVELLVVRAEDEL